MSRMALGFALIMMATPVFAHDLSGGEDAFTRYQRRTTSNLNCTQTSKNDEIVVCGRRDADRYRVPLIEYEAGDPRAEGLYGERERIQNRTNQCQERGPFLIGCGSVGVSVGIGLDGKGFTYRKLAD